MQNNSQLVQSLLDQSQVPAFQFIPPENTQFNARLLDSIDLNKINNQADMSSYEVVLKNFVFSKITEEQANNLKPQAFNKLLAVCKFAVENLVQIQDQKEALINEKLEKLQEKQEYYNQLQELEKKHQDKAEKMREEMAQLKEEYKKVKEKSLQNVYYKCHNCHKVFKTRDFLAKHLDRKHQAPSVLQGIAPDQLSTYLKQAFGQGPIINATQTGQISSAQTPQLGQTQSNFNGSQQNWNMGGTAQSWGVVGTTGQLNAQQIPKHLEDLQKRHEEKQRKKEEIKRLKQEKREKDRQERLQRIQDQNQLLLSMQSNIQNMIDSKISAVQKVQVSLISQQSVLKKQNDQLLEANKRLEQMQLLRVEQNIEVLDERSSIKQSSNKTQQLDSEQEQDSQGMKEDFMTVDPNLLKQNSQNESYELPKVIDRRVPTQQAAVNQDHSGVMSFLNNSYSVNNDLADLQKIKIFKQEAAAISRNTTVGIKNQAEMAHIGELESDDQSEEGKDTPLNNDGSYLKPLNKKSQFKKAEEDYLQAIYRKKNKNFEDEDYDENEIDIEEILENEKKKHHVPDREEILSSDVKDLHHILNKLQKVENQ